MASHMVEGWMNKIGNRYDPEYDVPPGPPVTWAEHSLMLAVLDLQEQVSELKKRIEGDQADEH